MSNTLNIRGASSMKVWDDLRVALTSSSPGSTSPTMRTWHGGIRAWHFSATIEQSLHFEVQLPHAWKTGSNVVPHIHWSPVAGGAAGEVVSWGLEYAVADIGANFSTTPAVIYANAHLPPDASLVDDRHYLTSFTAIDMSSVVMLSPMFVCRLFRDATGAGKTDDFASEAVGLEFDFHVQFDSFGSIQELKKW